MRFSKISNPAFWALLLFSGFAQAIDVTKSQYDLGCTGANTLETILTPGNVNISTFGKLFTKSVDGQVYAQPLYLQNFSIGGGVRNVVIVCTEHNSVYAFDADNGSAAAYWQRTLPTPQSISTCSNLAPNVGITATPVIDRAAGAVYVQAATFEGSAYFQKLFALNLTTGLDLIAPVTINDTVSGAGSGSGKIAFDALLNFFRPGLLLVNNRIYLGSGSHCDQGNYHGWLFAYNAADLTLSAVTCITPNGVQGSIWQYGGGISSDGNNIFCVSGNGTFSSSANNYGMSALKFDSTLNLVSFFTPYNYSSLNSGDSDLSSSCMLIPGSTVCTMQGKAGCIYFMNRNNLGGNHSSGDSIVQRINNAYGKGGGNNPVPVFWHNLFYLWAGNDSVKAFSFNGTTLNTTLQSSNSVMQSAFAGAISLSANGDTDGILWGTNVSTGHMYAFDAARVATMLWNDGQATGSRDILGSPVQKYARPIVANGKVYVPTTNSLVVYGLLQGSKTIGLLEHDAEVASVKYFKVTHRYFSLAFGGPGNYDVTIVDMSGRMVAKARGTTRGGNERFSMPGVGLQSGAFVAFVRFAQQGTTLKAILAQ